MAVSAIETPLLRELAHIVPWVLVGAPVPRVTLTREPRLSRVAVAANGARSEAGRNHDRRALAPWAARIREAMGEAERCAAQSAHSTSSRRMAPVERPRHG
jgi:hypothetical protein